MRSPFFDSCLIAVCGLLCATAARAGEDDLFLKSLKTPASVDMPSQLPEWLKTPPMKLDPVLEGILKQGNAIANGKGSVPDSTKSVPHGKWVFVSLSLPEQELEAAALEAIDAGAVMVFRGVPKDQDISALSAPLSRLAKEIKKLPPTVIDPTLFTRFRIAAVPALVSQEDNQAVRKVKGLPGFAWLSKQDAGDLGQRGPAYAISEPDMIEEIQRRAQAYDWEAEKQRALDNFWANQTDQVNLPPVSQPEIRRIDPSIVATQDIVLPDGRTVVKKGQQINPQAILPMRYVYVMFDASDAKQVNFAKIQGDAYLKAGKPVVYLFSKMDHRSGWDAYNKTAQFLNASIFKLLPTIVERFKIRALPSVVEGDGTALKVSEFLPGEL